jgi:hypothetical protein
VPRLVILEPDFRLVEAEIGGDLHWTLEVRDGVDAMGVEKWRTFKTDSKDLRAIFGYLTRLALELETMKRADHCNSR